MDRAELVEVLAHLQLGLLAASGRVAVRTVRPHPRLRAATPSTATRTRASASSRWWIAFPLAVLARLPVSGTVAAVWPFAPVRTVSAVGSVIAPTPVISARPLLAGAGTIRTVVAGPIVAGRAVGLLVAQWAMRLIIAPAIVILANLRARAA